MRRLFLLLFLVACVLIPINSISQQQIQATKESLPAQSISKLDGIWHKEQTIKGVGGLQIIMTFKGDRLKAKFVEFGFQDSDEVHSGSFEFYCSQHWEKDGYVVGRCLGVEFDITNIPSFKMEPATFAGMSKIEGEPFSFRCEHRDDVLFVSDLRLRIPEQVFVQKDIITAFATGTFKRTQLTKPPLPDLGKRRLQQNILPTNGISPVHPELIFQEPPRFIPTDIPNRSDLAVPQNPLQKQEYKVPETLLPPGTYKDTPIDPELRKKWEKSIEENKPSAGKSESKKP
jgi:hypothetical protein